jgi:GNAT superfamily N-acetyltransferase
MSPELGPEFRLAVPADAVTLIPFMREYYEYDGHAWHEDHAREALLGLLNDPQYGFAWLILDANTPVGYVVLTFGYSLEFLGRAFIDELFLLPAYRGRGWGTKTLEFLEGQARANQQLARSIASVATSITTTA